ncbi:hypothetical protein HRJ45_23530 [Vibrio coralliilyticus]|uniref:hypothetical protein n=1 Tax=Vibrio coralliilyticus TaxID=190893 RepID=UPI00156061AA|nr:hypothetical protein [Vibrio coralliilyticus]NRF27951.1 hypothetical protein [Vibrio coralliilyticus]NRF82087.1 hypothetical protein [Vibrio coralliilyticus]
MKIKILYIFSALVVSGCNENSGLPSQIEIPANQEINFSGAMEYLSTAKISVEGYSEVSYEWIVTSPQGISKTVGTKSELAIEAKQGESALDYVGSTLEVCVTSLEAGRQCFNFSEQNNIDGFVYNEVGAGVIAPKEFVFNLRRPTLFQESDISGLKNEAQGIIYGSYTYDSTYEHNSYSYPYKNATNLDTNPASICKKFGLDIPSVEDYHEFILSLSQEASKEQLEEGLDEYLAFKYGWYTRVNSWTNTPVVTSRTEMYSFHFQPNEYYEVPIQTHQLVNCVDN